VLLLSLNPAVRMKQRDQNKNRQPWGGRLFRMMRNCARRYHDTVATVTAASQASFKNDALLCDAIESISEGFVIYDAEDRFVMCNEAYRRLYSENTSAMVPGARYEDIMRSALAVGRYPDAKGREEEWLADWMRKHRQSEASVESQLKDGRWVLVSERPMANGGIAGLRVDITALKATQASLSASQTQLEKMAEELRRSEEHLARAQRITHTGSIVRDLRSSDAVEFSEEMYRLLGRDPTDPPPLKEEFLALIHPEDREKLVQLTKAAEHSLATEPFDCRVFRPDGTVRWLHNIAETVFDDEGRPIARIATFTDVTEKRAAEMLQKELERSLRMAKDAAEAANRAVQAANEDLERRVEERTRELRTAQDELLKKERLSTLGQLTATVAHELRNPMSAIRNTAYVLREAAGPNAPQFERPLARMERSIMRCENLIADLLDFTRPKEPNKQKLHLNTWLADILDDQKMSDGIGLDRRFAAADIVVALDPEQFRRVIINIIENAVQAIGINDDGGYERRVTVSTVASEFAEIRIEDTGPGISADILPRIFDPLFSTKSFGTGLGLPTVKKIVEQHDGTIEIASEAGRGASVLIRLPVSKAQAAVA
jgi:PAS domain S-box-containing protein